MKNPRRRCMECDAGMDAGMYCADCIAADIPWKRYNSLPWGPPVTISQATLAGLQHSANRCARALSKA